MPSYKITVAYDGTEYVGWQRQDNGVSIQALLEDAARALAGSDVTVTGAGRTDAGVHALGQVAAFTMPRALPADNVRRALNARLPDDIRIMRAEEVPASFHPRYGARRKIYGYRIWNGDVISPFERRHAWHVSERLDVDAMQAAARLLEGRHDFAAFQSTGSNVGTTAREIFTSRIAESGAQADCSLADEFVRSGGSVVPGNPHSPIRNPQSALLVYHACGDGFLRHMVRTIVGTLVEIGRGRQPVEWMAAVLSSRTRAQAGPTAPAAGLFLVSVDYDGAP